VLEAMKNYVYLPINMKLILSKFRNSPCSYILSIWSLWMVCYRES